MRVQKAIIPAAGLGIRFLPSTKTIPKEMLPIVDKPTIVFGIEEIIEADIPQVVLIAGRDKTPVEDYFDTSFELEALLERTNKTDLLKPIRDLRKRVQVISIRQQEALGLGHAILCAESLVGRAPFAVVLTDAVMLAEPGHPSAIGQLIKTYDEHGTSVVSVEEVPEEDLNQYGIAELQAKAPGLWSLLSATEKPESALTKSRMAITGRYIFNSEIFKALKEIRADRHGEFQLTDAMTILAKGQGVLARELKIERFDAREKLGFLRAQVEIGLRHPEIGASFKKYMQDRFKCKF